MRFWIWFARRYGIRKTIRAIAWCTRQWVRDRPPLSIRKKARP